MNIKITKVCIVLTLLSMFQLPINKTQANRSSLESPCSLKENEVQVSSTVNKPSRIVLPNLLFTFITKVK